ncbi:T9SS type A sorting domain-containing protein [uncultured Hymenobacter sp.]|uniref:T9SS type A sorting domain-containing protein n=1 Tax=uncultured Hymenobacter sp. TaxID=170016 RepID=UPI0035CAF28F
MKKLLRTAFLAVTIGVGGRTASAQTLDPTFAAIDIQQSGTVYNALQQPDGKYLVGGTFTQVNGSPAVGLARLNADGTLDQAFTNTAACQSSIFKIRLLANGQILLQGFSIIVGGQQFNTLAKLNADGSVAANFSVGSGIQPLTVTDVAVQADGKILVSGSFTNFNGVATNNLVRLNADGSVDQAFTTALGAGFVGANVGGVTVRGVEVQPDGKILVCGNFQNYNNTGRSGLLRLNADGSLDTTFNPVSSTSTTTGAEVLAVALDPRTNYILVHGYSFSTQQVVRLNTNGQLDTSFNLSAAPTCLSFSTWNSDQFVVDASGRVLLSSCFADYGGTGGDTYVTRFLANGQRDSQFAIRRQLGGNVYSLKVLSNGNVLIGGDFSRYGTIRNVSLLQVNDNAQAISSLRPALTQRGSVDDMELQSNGKLLVAGRFWQINGQAAGNVARLNADGTLDSSFQLAGVDGPVRQVAVQPDGRLVLGGTFATVGSQAQVSPVVARLLADGSADASFTAPPVVFTSALSSFNMISALVVQADGGILIGGSRIDMGGYNSALHRLLPNGTIDASYANQVGAGVLGGSVASLLALPDGKHYVGGTGLSTAPGLVRLNANGSRDNSFAAGMGSSTASFTVNKLLLLPNNQLLAGGFFTSYNGTARTHLTQLNPDGTIDMSYTPPVLAGNGVSMLARYANGRVLVGSSFLTINGASNNTPLVRLNPNGSHDASFLNAVPTGVGALLLQPDESFVVSGSFSTIGGQPRVSLARFTAPNVLAVGSRQSVAQLEAWPNPARQQLHLSLDASAKPQKLVLLDALGKTVLSEPITKAALTLPVQHLPAGVYLLRVDYADGPVTRRVVLE